MAEANEQGWLKALFGLPMTAQEQAEYDAWEAVFAARESARKLEQAQIKAANQAYVRQLRRTRQ